MVQTEDIALQPKPFGEGNSKLRTAMDISKDGKEEALLKLNEDELRNQQKVNSIQCIEAMKLSSKEASKFDIPLYQMIYMPVVHPTLPKTSKGWRLSSSMDIGLEHPCSMCPPPTRMGKRSL